jgi:hypothetical protein
MQFSFQNFTGAGPNFIRNCDPFKCCNIGGKNGTIHPDSHSDGKKLRARRFAFSSPISLASGSQSALRYRCIKIH